MIDAANTILSGTAMGWIRARAAARREGIAMTVRHADDMPRDPVGAGKGTVRQVLIGPDGGRTSR